MGIFTEYLTITSKRRLTSNHKKEASQKQEDQKQLKDEKTDINISAMDSTPYFVTLDGQPPNGGVPPDRLFVPSGPMNIGYDDLPDDETPPKPGPPVQPPSEPQRTSSSGNQGVLHAGNAQNEETRSNTQNINLHVTVNGAYTQHSMVEDVAMLYKIEKDSNEALEDVKTWMKLIRYGSRPYETYPDAYREELKTCTWEVPQSTSIRVLLAGCLRQLGYPARDGFGVQVVHRVGHGVWRPGPIFRWNEGEPDMQIGATSLGRGIQGDEVHVCLWKR